MNAFRSGYQREIYFHTKNSPQISVATDEKKLKQLLYIFLDNARKYSDEAHQNRHSGDDDNKADDDNS
ncbi:signal transduction histidine kinase [Neobacillus sp. B4I6]|uniref:hypothetical protein n=1 Tax=Neobacillus sp. B4I6 TaxID=3373925 RepID=UPI003D2257DC